MDTVLRLLSSLLVGIELGDSQVCDVSQVEDLLEVSEGVVRLCDLFVALIVAFSTVLRDILELGFDVVYLVLNFLSLLRKIVLMCIVYTYVTYECIVYIDR